MQTELQLVVERISLLLLHLVNLTMQIIMILILIFGQDFAARTALGKPNHANGV